MAGDSQQCNEEDTGGHKKTQYTDNLSQQSSAQSFHAESRAMLYPQPLNSAPPCRQLYATNQGGQQMGQQMQILTQMYGSEQQVPSGQW